LQVADKEQSWLRAAITQFNLPVWVYAHHVIAAKHEAATTIADLAGVKKSDARQSFMNYRM